MISTDFIRHDASRHAGVPVAKTSLLWGWGRGVLALTTAIAFLLALWLLFGCRFGGCGGNLIRLLLCGRLGGLFFRTTAATRHDLTSVAWGYAAI